MMEAVVIGSGLAGCAVALELWRGGAAVNVVERERPGAGATGASAGMLAPQYEATGPTAHFHLLASARAYYPVFARRLERLGGRYVVPRSDGSVLAGSTMDAAGFDRTLNAGGARMIREAACALLPDLADRRPSEEWADLRPMTPDGRAVLGRDPELEGLLYATGYGRSGQAGAHH